MNFMISHGFKEFLNRSIKEAKNGQQSSQQHAKAVQPQKIVGSSHFLVSVSNSEYHSQSKKTADVAKTKVQKIGVTDKQRNSKFNDYNRVAH